MASPTLLIWVARIVIKNLSQGDIQKIYRAEQLYCENEPYMAYHAIFNSSKTIKMAD